jgi:hypothetical protein
LATSRAHAATDSPAESGRYAPGQPAGYDRTRITGLTSSQGIVELTPRYVGGSGAKHTLSILSLCHRSHGDGRNLYKIITISCAVAMRDDLMPMSHGGISVFSKIRSRN